MTSCRSAPAWRAPARRGGWCADREGLSRSRPVGRPPAGRSGWTPAQDRLFDGAAERRRFFDRLVFAAEPAHAAHVVAHDRSSRQRMRLLTGDEAPDPAAWAGGAGGADGRERDADGRGPGATLAALQAEIDERGERPFPQAALTLTGEWEKLAGQGAESHRNRGALQPRALAAARERDGGRTGADRPSSRRSGGDPPAQ